MLLNCIDLSGFQILAQEYERKPDTVTLRGPVLVGLQGPDIVELFVALAPALVGSHKMSLDIGERGAKVCATIEYRDRLSEQPMEPPASVRLAQYYDFRLDSASPFFVSSTKIQVSHSHAGGWLGCLETEQVIVEDEAWRSDFDFSAYARRHAEKHQDTPFSLEKWENGTWRSVLGPLRPRITRAVRTEVMETRGRNQLKVYTIKMTAPLAFS